MEFKDISQTVLEKIKEKHISPKPRWEFLLKDYTIWLFSLVLLLIGSAAVSVIIFMLKNNDWGNYRFIHHNLATFIILTLPYFWLVFLGLFIVVAFYNFRHTKKGYRFEWPVIVIGCVLISALAGGVLYGAGAGQAIDEILGARAPWYGRIINHRVGLWAHPFEGRLAGVVISVNGVEEFTLLDPLEVTWIVISKDALIMPPVLINPGERIKMIGEKLETNTFKASRIMPFGLPGKGFFEERMKIRMQPGVCPDPMMGCGHDLPLP